MTSQSCAGRKDKDKLTVDNTDNHFIGTHPDCRQVQLAQEDLLMKFVSAAFRAQTRLNATYCDMVNAQYTDKSSFERPIGLIQTNWVFI